MSIKFNGFTADFTAKKQVPKFKIDCFRTSASPLLGLRERNSNKLKGFTSLFQTL